MAYHEIEKESFLHRDGEERVFFVDKDARERLDDAESRLDDLEQGGGGGSGAVDSVNGKTGAVVLDASDVGALPDDTVIPAAVTEQTVSVWGFTKNTGTYTKPSGGIPASDLASGVIPTVPTKVSDLTNDSGFITASQVPAELPAVTASDNGKFLRVVNGAWAAQAIPAAESNSFGGGS